MKGQCITSWDPIYSPTPIADYCADGIQNYGEEGVDCGGPCVTVCPVVPTCFDGVQNGDETGTDCGGSCATTCTPVSLSLKDLRDKTISFYTGSGASTSDSYMKDSLNRVKGGAQGALDTINADGSWPDIDYTSKSGAGNPINKHFKRITSLAEGYATPGQTYYKNSQVKKALENSIIYLDSVQTLKDCKYPYPSSCGWAGFLFSVDFPKELSKSLLLVKDDISSQAYSVGMRQTKEHMRALSSSSRTNYNFYTAIIYLHIGLTELDGSRVMQSRTTMNNIMTTNDVLQNSNYYDSIGLKPDSTYLDHGPLLYTGGYGEEYGQYMALFNYLVSGSQYEVDASNLNNIVNYYADGVAFAANDKYFDISVKGRTVSRGLELDEHAEGLILMANTPSAKNSIITSAAKKYLQSTVGERYDISTAGLIAKINQRSESAKWPSGQKHYPFADYTIHRRSNYFLSIKSLSDRTFTSEVVSAENKKGALLMDGRMHLTLKGDEYAGDVLPTLDWARLPGITVQKQPNVEILRGLPSGNYLGLPSGFGWPGKKQIVGGTTDGQNGVSAMDYQGLDDYKGTFTPELSWKKSWFFFDDYVVFITDNIKDTSGYNVETIIDQRPLIASNTPMYYNGFSLPTNLGYTSELNNVEWFSANNIGYYFPERETINVKRAKQSGSWYDLNTPYGSKTTVSSNIFTLWVDHSTNPNGADAVYVVVPDVTKDEMADWVQTNRLNIIKHDSTVVAVEDSKKKMFGAVFWKAGTLNSVPNNIFTSISADAPATIFIERLGGEIEVSVSDPTHSSGKLRITFNNPFTKISADSGVVVSSSGGKTYVDIPRSSPYGGATKKFKLGDY